MHIIVILHNTPSADQVVGVGNLQLRIRENLKGIGYEF